MAEIKDFLGALLRDIVEARVRSDLHTRDLGLEYLEDEILRDFPVPRVELKEASVRLRFAVDAVEVGGTEPEKVVKRLAGERAPAWSKLVIQLVVEEHPKRDEIVELLRRKEIDLAALVTRRMVVTMSDPGLVLPALEGDREALVKALVERLRAAFTSDPDLAKILVPSRNNRHLHNVLMAAQARLIDDLVERAAAEIGEGKRPRIKLDLAVTRRELDGVPEGILSEIGVVTEIRNHVWSESPDEDGERHLLPE